MNSNILEFKLYVEKDLSLVKRVFNIFSSYCNGIPRKLFIYYGSIDK